MVIPCGCAGDKVPHASHTTQKTAQMSSSAHDSQESSSEEGEPSAQVPPSRETTKRSSGKVRKDHIGQGAFVIEFKNPTAPRNMILSPVQPAGLNPSPSFEGKNRKKVENDYRGMERKGFRVTSDIGCLLPDDRFGTREAGATLKGHQRTFQFSLDGHLEGLNQASQQWLTLEGGLQILK